MSMVVDTCVILDILQGDPIFGEASARTIDQYAEGGLIISPLTYVELSPAFLGDEARERDFLFEIGIDLPPILGEDDLSLAHTAWNKHIQLKRSGKVTKRRPTTDSSPAMQMIFARSSRHSTSSHLKSP